MKKQLPLPLTIDCEGLSKKLIADLADRLAMHFEDVKVFGEEIEAYKPLSMANYDIAWKIIDRYGVKAV